MRRFGSCLPADAPDYTKTLNGFEKMVNNPEIKEIAEMGISFQIILSGRSIKDIAL